MVSALIKIIVLLPSLLIRNMLTTSLRTNFNSFSSPYFFQVLPLVLSYSVTVGHVFPLSHFSDITPPSQQPDRYTTIVFVFHILNFFQKFYTFCSQCEWNLSPTPQVTFSHLLLEVYGDEFCFCRWFLYLATLSNSLSL